MLLEYVVLMILLRYSSSWSSNRFILGGYSHIRIERDTHKSYLSTLLKPIETSLPSNTKAGACGKDNLKIVE